MSQIYDPPNDYDFGLSFNYDVWTAGSTIKLTTVPWDSMYRDVVLFNSRALLDAYIDGKANSIPVNNLFHIKPNRPVVRLDIPYNTALKYNYLKVTNSAQPLPGGDTVRSFYYFVREVNYISPSTTEFVIQLDVWQTYIYELDVKSGYLERGHAAITTDVNGLKTPEPFDMGDTYVTAGDTYKHPLVNAFDPANPSISFYVAITSVVELTELPGTETAPELPAAHGSVVQGVLSPASVYCLTLEGYLNFMSFASMYPWMMQGIIDIRLYPQTIGIGDKRTRKPNPDPAAFGAYWPPGETTSGTDDSYLRYPPYNPNESVAIPNITGFRNRIRQAMKDALPSSWEWAVDRFQKFMTAPYSFIEFHSQQGESVNLSPEGFTGEDIVLSARGSIAPGDVRFAVRAENYTIDRSLDNCFTITNMPQLPILNNNAGITMASQQRALQQSRASASWSQQKALDSARVGASNAYAGINAAREQGNIARSLDATGVAIGNELSQKRATLDAVTGIIGGAIGGAAGGAGGIAVGTGMAIGGAVANSIGTGMTIDANNQQLAARTAASQSSQDIGLDNTRYVTDNNKRLAQGAARGDYADTIAAIDAKVQDAQMIPPSMAGSFGGSVSLLAMHGDLSLRARVKHVDAQTIIRVAQQWSRYGYYANRFMNVGNIKRYSKFTYWKLLETYIDSSGVAANEEVLLTVRGIFEKGVTVWNNPTDIGNYDFEGNQPL